jgi:5-methyltetrahydropteroyltriglutamate--homocysteine methyltransferase
MRLGNKWEENSTTRVRITAMTPRNRPPYRADHVGSLLRPKYLLDARERKARGEIDAAALRAVEDRAIAEAVKFQEDIGLRAITDGEYRRTYFHIDFLEQLEGVSVHGGIGTKFHTAKGEVDFAPPRLEVSGKLRHVKAIQVEDFAYLKSQVKSGTPKVCIPSPTMVHFRGGRGAISKDAYPDMEGFFDDLAACYRKELAALGAAGCTYVQLDDTNLAYLCDPQQREAARKRGEDPDALPHTYARLINAAIEDKPQGMTVGIHLCRGNFKSAWVAEGGYDPVAEALFNELAVDGIFLEYDDYRSGDFSPLRFVPKGKIIVLGLVSSKLGELEPKDAIKRRIEEAARHMPLEQMCLSPQCGFSSTVHGNDISVENQRAKLALVRDVAREVWGEA